MILAAADALLDLSGPLTAIFPTPDASAQHTAAANRLQTAVRAADTVSSQEIRERAEYLRSACTISTQRAARYANAPIELLTEERVGETNQSWREARAAYEALRDQVQRETRA